MAYSAKAIANYFINKAKKENDQKLDSMKLLKLIYIAHGVSLANLDKRLINEEIEAWKYGPVIRDIYQEVKYSGLMPIHDLIKGRIPGEESFDDDTKLLLKKVWENYKENTSVDLSNWSHDEEGPWYEIVKVKNNGNVHFFNAEIIPENKIKEYFKKKITEENIEE